jgi:predicted nucleic acid-binding Zn finger protein
MKARWHDCWRFYVSSQSKRDRAYLVDLIGETCDCPDFVINRERRSRCKHFEPALLAFADMMLVELRKADNPKHRHD